MKYLQIFLAMTIMAFTVSACQYKITINKKVNDSTVKEKTLMYDVFNEETNKQTVSDYPYRDFSSIRASGAIKIIYTQGDKYSVRVVEKGSPHTVVLMKDHELTIKPSKKKLFISVEDNTMPKAYITSPHLNEVVIGGASEFSAKNMTMANMKMNVSGASKINIGHMECSSLSMQVSGSSKMLADVKAPRASVNASGASKVDVNFLGKDIQVQNSGASTLTLKLDCERLKANNCGASKLIVSGYVDDVDIKKRGVSKVDTTQLNRD